MRLTLTVPDELLAAITRAGGDPGRAALEALALEAYRERRIDACQLRTVLGISSNAELGDFLRSHQMEMREVEIGAASSSGSTLGDLAGSEFAGIWGDRADIADSVSFARRLRDEAWQQPG